MFLEVVAHPDSARIYRGGELTPLPATRDEAKAIGIPLAVAALPLAAWQLYEWRWDLWWRPVVLLVVGYLLQWLGHLWEGNDLGEVVLIKKLLAQEAS